MPLSKEECEAAIYQINSQIATTHDEIAKAKLTIGAKVPGTIRIAQKKKRELKQHLQTLIARKNTYYNGGVC